MEPVRTLSRSTGLALLVAAAAGGAGCKSAMPLTDAVHSVRREVLAERPPPASQVGCLWQRSLAQLPDPTRDGMQAPGLPGQVFMLTPAGTAAEVDGDLAVMVYDDTPRPPGVKEHDPEMWHFDRDTLAKLATVDERFGKCYALFLPWPAHWRDVTQVRIQARYESKGFPTLYAREQKISLDFSPGGSSVWTDMGSGRVVSPAAFPGFDNRSVPDPQKYLQEAARQQSAHQGEIQRAGGSLFLPNQPPPQTTAGGVGLAPAAWPAAKSAGGMVNWPTSTSSTGNWSPPTGPTLPSGPAMSSPLVPGGQSPPADGGARAIILPSRSGL